MPVEYRKALVQMAKAQAADKDGLEKIDDRPQGGQGLKDFASP